MSDANNTPEKKLTSLDPRKTFFLVAVVGNLDGSLDLGSDIPDGFVTLEEAINFAKEQVDEGGCEVFIYECRPLRRVSRVQVIVENLEIAQTHSQE